MSYKEKAATVGEYRGGALSVQDKPKVLRYPCFADGCPMPGTIFAGSTDKAGTCAWHYGVLPTDIPKVTQVLKDWQCLAFEVRECRRVLTGELATDPKAQADAFAQAWERLKPLVPGWEDKLTPGNVHTSKGVDTGYAQSYADWGKHLERFLGARVLEVLSTRQRRAA